MAELTPEKRAKKTAHDHKTRKTAGGRYPIPLVDLWEMAAKRTNRNLHCFIRDVVTAAAVKVMRDEPW